MTAAGLPATDGPGLYVYAVVPAGLDPATLGAGIDGASLELVEATEGLAAVVHRHGAPPYTGSDSEAERRVLEHSNVVERCWAHAGSVLPMGFNVIVANGNTQSARERLTEWLDRSGPALSERLSIVRGRVELRVEISLDEGEAARTSDEALRLEEELTHRPAGVQRLLRRKLASLVREAAEESANRRYPEYRRRLAALSQDIVENLRGHPPAGCVTVLNVSVLVDREDVPRIGAELAEIQAEDAALRVRFLGPWPPFSFADVPGLREGTKEAGGA